MRIRIEVCKAGTARGSGLSVECALRDWGRYTYDVNEVFEDWEGWLPGAIPPSVTLCVQLLTLASLLNSDLGLDRQPPRLFVGPSVRSAARQ
jgi:hypothetical protein